MPGSLTGACDTEGAWASMHSGVLIGTTLSHVSGVSFGPCLSPYI